MPTFAMINEDKKFCVVHKGIVYISDISYYCEPVYIEHSYDVGEFLRFYVYGKIDVSSYLFSTKTKQIRISSSIGLREYSFKKYGVGEFEYVYSFDVHYRSIILSPFLTSLMFAGNGYDTLMPGVYSENDEIRSNSPVKMISHNPIIFEICGDVYYAKKVEKNFVVKQIPVPENRVNTKSARNLK